MMRRCAGLPWRECIEVTRSTRCPTCESMWKLSRPSVGAYDRGYQRRRDAALAAEPWCHAEPCRWPETAGTPANPLTADHTIPVSFGGQDSALVILCRNDNSSRGNRYMR